MIEKYAVILWLAYFLIMSGLCYLCAFLRIIQKSEIIFFLIYTWIMGGLCVLCWYFDIRFK